MVEVKLGLRVGVGIRRWVCVKEAFPGWHERGL